MPALDRVLTAYRIGDPNGRYPIFDATGSSLHPGRWNTPETPVIYTSEHYSTAMLEKLVHAGAAGMPPNQHFIAITIPNGLSYEMVTKDRLPGWADRGARPSRTFGAAWAKEKRSAILLVPSFVARIERNVVINPAHPEAAAIRWILPEPVWWDERLYR